jgi:plasmid stabilization system protein ParE
MSFTVVVEKEAEEDLKAVANWLAQYSGNKAVLWYFDATEAIESLGNFPARCPLAPESRKFGVEIRHLIFDKYRILFIIDDETVYVLRVRHQAQDVL